MYPIGYIDNKGTVDLSNQVQNKSHQEHMLEDILDHINYDYYDTEAATLIPDWDLISKYKTMIKNNIFANWKFEWIASHQDRKQTYDSLSLPAQLNCDADRIAESQHYQHQTETPWIVPLSNNCSVHLDIQGKTITSRYE